jgi:hypothetical protein
LLPAQRFFRFLRLLIRPNPDPMKKRATSILIALFASIACFGQSESYTLLKEKFRGYENVYSISTSGIVTRTVLLMAGEHEYNNP